MTSDPLLPRLACASVAASPCLHGGHGECIDALEFTGRRQNRPGSRKPGLLR